MQTHEIILSAIATKVLQIIMSLPDHKKKTYNKNKRAVQFYNLNCRSELKNKWLWSQTI